VQQDAAAAPAECDATSLNLNPDPSLKLNRQDCLLHDLSRGAAAKISV